MAGFWSTMKTDEITKIITALWVFYSAKMKTDEIHIDHQSILSFIVYKFVQVLYPIVDAIRLPRIG